MKFYLLISEIYHIYIWSSTEQYVFQGNAKIGLDTWKDISCNSTVQKLHSMSLIASFMGPTWGPSGADRTQVGPVLAPWTLLSGLSITIDTKNLINTQDCSLISQGIIKTLSRYNKNTVFISDDANMYPHVHDTCILSGQAGTCHNCDISCVMLHEVYSTTMTEGWPWCHKTSFFSHMGCRFGLFW